jgi:putative heme-binding domain-containing protein
MGSAQPVALRVAAIESADKTMERGELLKLLSAIVARGEEPAEIRAKAAGLLGAIDADEARTALTAALAQAPTALERDFALALCQNQPGMTALVDTIAAGKAAAQLLNDPNVFELLSTRAADADKARVAEFKKDLPAADERLAKLITLHRERFNAGKASADRGRELFTKHCGACHRIGPEGAMVGPQLDGVGNRGLDRVLEDVLDPNRNVDVAFRTSLYVTVDGKVHTGLERRREGEIVVIADAQGKEIRIPAAEIEESRRTELSLMPANYSQQLKPSELQDLVGYLLSQRQAAE